MPTALHTTPRVPCRSSGGAAFRWGVALAAVVLLGQATSAAPITLYDSINGSTAASSDVANNGTWLANQFNTDAVGYNLDSIILDFVAAPLGSIAVDIYSDASGTPDTNLGTLGNPGSFVVGSNTFSAAGIPTLAAGSSFWVVLRGLGSGSVGWNWTNDTPTGNGSSVNTNNSGNSGQTWGGVVPGTPYMMTVNATPSAVPEIDPASFGSALSLVLGSLTLLERRRRQG